MSILNSPAALVERWSLQGDARGSLGRYDGTAANMTGWPASFLKNSLTCGEMNGNNSNINVGDVVELNAVSAFTIAFWMNQDVIDQGDIIFQKLAAAAGRMAIFTWTDGNIYLEPNSISADRGYFDYSAVIDALQWHHMTIVFDGGQVGNANKLLCYVDGAAVTLSFTGTIAATTPDLSGQNALIGAVGGTFDGRLFDFRIYNRALSRDQIATLMHAPLALI